MSVFESITGRAYTIDDDYATMRGRVVGTQTTETHDHRRNVTIRTTRTLIDIGRGDPVTPDPDAAIEPEGPRALGFKSVGHSVKRSRTSDLLERVYAVLLERPHNATQIAAATGESVPCIRALVQNHPDGLVVLAGGLYGKVYGLPGHQYAESVYNGTLPRILAFLSEHGPSPASVVCAALGIVHSTFDNARKANPDEIKLVDTVRTAHNNYRPVRIWDVAE